MHVCRWIYPAYMHHLGNGSCLHDIDELRIDWTWCRLQMRKVWQYTWSPYRIVYSFCEVVGMFLACKQYNKSLCKYFLLYFRDGSDMILWTIGNTGEGPVLFHAWIDCFMLLKLGKVDVVLSKCFLFSVELVNQYFLLWKTIFTQRDFL